ncbi:MAG: antibiotic biosynthesis monooxygenase [Rhodobacteraceae bacterium]|nr:antibiotic biosynthesis monooxygenase [Paracoccaceae bacterium]
MLKVERGGECQTIITTFEMTPGTAHDLMDELRDAYEVFIRRQPGFIAAALHMNDAQTRIANYSQWRRREDFQAMLRTPEMRERNRRIAALCSRFEPVMYDVVEVVAQPAVSG